MAPLYADVSARLHGHIKYIYVKVYLDVSNNKYILFKAREKNVPHRIPFAGCWREVMVKCFFYIFFSEVVERNPGNNIL